MKDRIPTKVLDNGAVRYGVYDEAGTFLRYEYIRKEDAPEQLGTILNKATLLKDETASKLGLTQADPTVDDAFNGLFQSVSDGKKLVASAITDKGVATAPDATFQTMSNNIKKISTIPPNVHTVTLKASPAAGGTVSGGGYASRGMKVQVSASPANEYIFGRWKKSGTEVSSNSNYLLQVTGDTVLTAEFYKSILQWTGTSLPFTSRWNSVAYGGGKFVAVASDDNKSAYSNDGITWSTSTLPSSEYWHGIAYGNGKFVAVAYGIFVYSTDGINWSSVSPLYPFNYRDWSHIAYGNGKFVAITLHNSVENNSAYSTDGINWAASTIPSFDNDFLEGIAYGNGKFVVVASGSNQAAYSSDGINWSVATLPVSAMWHGIAYGNGKFVAIDLNGYIAYSSDGINWAIAVGEIRGNHGCVAYGNGKFVVAEDTFGYYIYSEDGVNWGTFVGMPFKATWSSAAYGNGKFVAISSSYRDETDEYVDSNKAAYALA